MLGFLALAGFGVVGARLKIFRLSVDFTSGPSARIRNHERGAAVDVDARLSSSDLRGSFSSSSDGPVSFQSKILGFWGPILRKFLAG